MAWIYLVIASLGEFFGVLCINLYLKKKSFGWLLMLIRAVGFGFIFVSLAMRDVPLEKAYEIWTGLGAAGAVLMGIIFFKESAGWKRILFLFCIIAGAVGLKLL